MRDGGLDRTTEGAKENGESGYECLPAAEKGDREAAANATYWDARGPCATGRPEPCFGAGNLRNCTWPSSLVKMIWFLAYRFAGAIGGGIPPGGNMGVGRICPC
jgi:hypothetical protein